MTRKLDPSRALSLIEDMVRPLEAPVKQFESRIRTDPLRTLISVLLSARTQDAVTLAASERLFAGIRDHEDLNRLDIEEIERRIYPVGFFRQKARHIKEIAQRLTQGLPLQADRESLMALPGVGRKTANLVLALAFGVPAITVDIHVFRISRRLGWTRAETPLGVETDLMGLFKRDTEWIRLNQALVAFGQTLCRPVGPRCGGCRLREDCPAAQTEKSSRNSAGRRSQQVG